MSLLMAAVAAVSASTIPVPLDGALGANFNEHYEDVDFAELRRANDRWIRGFLTMPDLDRDRAVDHKAILTTLEAKRRGFATILTLKWPLQKSGIPRTGTPAFARALRELDAVLPLVMGEVDILEIGNEPFIESRKSEWDQRLNDFYEAMARRAIAYRAEHCPATCRTRLFMGALNKLNRPTWRTPVTDRWLSFVRETPGIAGVDIHPHVRSIGETKDFLDYVVPRLRPDQTFIATEFSLIWHWRQHLRDRVPPAFAKRYDVSPKTQVWQEIDHAIAEPVSQRRWDDLLQNSDWFADNRRYLSQQMAMFRATGRLAVATYGFKQGRSMTHHFGPDKAPWLLNSVIAGRTVQQHPDGTAGTNPYWLSDFRRLAQPPTGQP